MKEKKLKKLKTLRVSKFIVEVIVMCYVIWFLLKNMPVDQWWDFMIGLSAPEALGFGNILLWGWLAVSIVIDMMIAYFQKKIESN
jgi:hypothetical protein